MWSNRRLMIVLLTVVVSTAYFGFFAANDHRLIKPNMLFFDNIRAVRGEYSLNDRVTPLFHPAIVYAGALLRSLPFVGTAESAGRLASMLGAVFHSRIEEKLGDPVTQR